MPQPCSFPGAALRQKTAADGRAIPMGASYQNHLTGRGAGAATIHSAGPCVSKENLKHPSFFAKKRTLPGGACPKKLPPEPPQTGF